MSVLGRLPKRLRSRSDLGRLRSTLGLGLRGNRTIVVAVAAAVVIFAGCFLWLRDSGLVAVDEVSVSGLTSEDAGKIRSALVRAGHRMTSLHVDQDALERAVSGFPEVRALEARGDFPSGLRITVVERRPAAVVVAGESRVAVAGDGTVLPGLEYQDGLPEVREEGPAPVGRLGGGDVLNVVSVLDEAPAALENKLEKGALDRERGVVLQLRDGPKLVFGTGAQLGAKWAAAARVLAHGDSTGAEYIDLTIPERPAAGGLPAQMVAPVAPAGEDSALPGLAPALPEPQP